MFNWTFSFLILAIIAGFLGFSGIAGVAVGIAKVTFFVSLIFWIIALAITTFAKKK